MYISLMNSLSSGFRKWSDTHQPDHDNDKAGGGTPIPITDQPVDDPVTTPEQPHQPWLVPGAGGSF